jgi:hypothetical protein
VGLSFLVGMTVDDPLVPPDERLIGGVLGKRFDLALAAAASSSVTMRTGRSEPGHAVCQHHVVVDLLLRAVVGFVKGHDDPACDFLQAGQAAQLAHAVFRPATEHQMRRLVPRRTDPAQDLQVATILVPQGLADFVEEVGVDRRAALDLLRRAGEVDRRGQELFLAVEEEQHFDGVVFVALDASEVALVGAAVHHRAAVGVDRAAVVSDDGMPQAPRHGAGLAILPGRATASDTRSMKNRRTRSAGQPLRRECGRPFSEHRAGVGVRAAHEQFLRVEVRQTLRHSLRSATSTLCGSPMMSPETMIAESTGRSPSRDSSATTWAVTGLSTDFEIRVCICPHRAMG